MGRLVASRRHGDVLELELECASIASELTVGASVAVSGVCLTAKECRRTSFLVDLAQETIGRTRLSALGAGDEVNLELPLKPADRLGGHFVQGHVDDLGRVTEAGSRDRDYILRVEHAPEGTRFVVEKGSIAIDGVSLTVTRCGSRWFEVMLIPHTLSVTTLGRRRAGDFVHLEYDILAKYVAHFAETYGFGAKGEGENRS